MCIGSLLLTRSDSLPRTWQRTLTPLKPSCPWPVCVVCSLGFNNRWWTADGLLWSFMTFSLHSCRGSQWTPAVMVIFDLSSRISFHFPDIPTTSEKPTAGQIISVQRNASSAVWMVGVTQRSLPQRHCCACGVLSADRNTQSVTEWRLAPAEGQQDVQCHTGFPASHLRFHLDQRICTAHFLLRENGGSESPSSFLIFFSIEISIYKNEV